MVDQSALGDYDTTEKVERTDKGFRLTVVSKRGTGTRDQDSVKGEARTETLGTLQEKRPAVRNVVIETMNELRENQPDSEEGE